VQQRLAFGGVHEVRTPDLPGHGHSDEAPLERITEMAGWLARTSGPLSDAVLIGHSMGASVALAVAVEDPPRGLVLVGATRRPRVSADFLTRVARDSTVAVERLATAGFASGARSALIERASTFLAKTEPAVLARDFTASARFDATPLLAKVRVPSLLIVGQEDRLTTVAEAEDLARDIAGAELVVIANAGHMVMLERPREFNQALASFAAKL
jgi:pimeloyl-ACP methyl ester carboxylesterase